jgi:hypothetical protein
MHRKTCKLIVGTGVSCCRQTDPSTAPRLRVACPDQRTMRRWRACLDDLIADARWDDLRPLCDGNGDVRARMLAVYTRWLDAQRVDCGVVALSVPPRPTRPIDKVRVFDNGARDPRQWIGHSRPVRHAIEHDKGLAPASAYAMAGIYRSLAARWADVTFGNLAERLDAYHPSNAGPPP